MRFTHDTRAALVALCALVNTAATLSDSGEDELRAPADVMRFVEAHGYTGAVAGDVQELVAVRAVRERLARLWDVGEDALVAEVNALLREHDAVPQLVRHDGYGWHIHAVDPGTPLADRIAVESALAVVDVLRMEQLSRMRRCRAEDCEAVLVDLSRNSSKRYCDTGNCANRAHVAAYRRRQAEES